MSEKYVDLNRPMWAAALYSDIVAQLMAVAIALSAVG
jgi:hypothetical protein